MLNRNMLNSARRVALVALLAGAALSANAFVIKTVTFFSGVDGGDTTDSPNGLLTTLPKFNPSLGTLLQAEVGTVAVSSYDFSVTNSNSSGTEDVKYSVDSWAGVAVGLDPTSTSSVFGSLVGLSYSEVTTSGENPALAAGDSITGSDSFQQGPDFFDYSGISLTGFIASGSDNSLGVFQEYFNHSRFQGANIDQQANLFSASQSEVTYTYAAVPAPAAAGTMLVGMVGALVRRRRKA